MLMKDNCHQSEYDEHSEPVTAIRAAGSSMTGTRHNLNEDRFYASAEQGPSRPPQLFRDRSREFTHLKEASDILATEYSCQIFSAHPRSHGSVRRKGQEYFVART